MNNNELKLTINVSDELLAKLLHIMQKPNMTGIPMQALLGMAIQPPATKEAPPEKPTIGFKT